ncbi:glycosyltransferase family A protein [Clostridium beijerinckii]|uniref:glycosyltransferase family A protein n=1 Tax=Clostridium beijerinckii TaxID=1520 RepID=UPI0013610354|nr:glycosyltransferase family 2 protein [Clostridium beijerinckii]MZK52739.1 glycosyltransferase [Clostridium beijerinckii]MZK60846.1 glycosyltransferase [Clostridium beijerinckii]MZK71052.1 glycosyltransferase [Clostridium beijerinckii]MZK76383.1 glycosyltransferase [Clostridium beijerinckii]MZK86111.1 glycosyltransferase [Clostridium beijerinckii]
MNRKFSLILATMGDEPLIKDLLESLKNQTYKNFEVIIVNQGEYGRLFNLVNEYINDIDIKYIHTSIKGLSRARNLGIAQASGDIFTFPDDDCEYRESTLEQVNDFFSDKEYDIYTFKVFDKASGEESVTNWIKQSCEINSKNVFRIGVSITTFIRIKDKENIVFDEKLGLGAMFGSGEETDLILQLLHREYKGYYCFEQYIFHPSKPKNLTRGYGYALGTGAVYYKEIFLRKNYMFIIKYLLSIIKPILNVFSNIIKLDKKLIIYNLSIIKGRLNGFFTYRMRNRKIIWRH